MSSLPLRHLDLFLGRTPFRRRRDTAPSRRGAWLAASIALILLLALAPTAHAIDLPAQFVADNLAPGAGFVTPVAATFLPDGRMLVAEKRGRVYIVENGIKRTPPLWSAESEVLDQHDRGLLDVAVDPNYVVNHYIYLLYTVDPQGSDGTYPAFGRLTRYQMSFTDPNALDVGSRTVLMGATWPAGPCVGSGSHTIGSLRWGEDGSLLVSTGDGASFTSMDDGGRHPSMFGSGKTDPDEDIGAFRAQDVGSLTGKVLRINPATGNGYPSNPYYDGNAGSPRSKVWSYGFRNPFRFAVKPGSGSPNDEDGDPGTLYIGDVGWANWEEINVANAPGQNFGWPCYEGEPGAPEYPNADPAHHDCSTIGTPENPAAARFAVAAWNHTTPSISIPPGLNGSCTVGGVFYTGTQYPGSLRNRFFFADYEDSWIKVLDTGVNDELIQLVPFATDVPGPVDLVLEPGTGNVVVVAAASNQILRIRYTGSGGNDDPVAVASATPTSGLAPLTVSFSSAGSIDPDDDPLQYAWSFGDGNGSSEANPQHTYGTAGVYAAYLTVLDGNGGSGQDGITITVTAPETGFPTTPVLDAFDRPNGPIGGLWVDNTAALRISNQRLIEVGPDATTVWNGGVFGPSQEVYVRLTQVTADAPEHDLMMKVQGLTWSSGHIEVRYDAYVHRIYVSTYHPVQGWQTHGDAALTLQAGDQLGARAHPNGDVEVFVNGAAVLAASVASWPHASQGGRLGMTIVGATDSQLDDFGGGDVGVNAAPTVQIVTPADSSFYAEGDTVRLTCAASDAQQAPSTLAYHWDVHLHHSSHSHPSSYSSDSASAAFVGENHEDGQGVWMEVVVRVTDQGGLADTARVAIFPETDLGVTPAVVTPETLTTTEPGRFRFVIRNDGGMPTRRSHWALRAGSYVLAEGDTVVAPHDSLEYDFDVPPMLPPGEYDLDVIADEWNVVVETDESNNVERRPLTVVWGHITGVESAPGRLALSEGYPNPSLGRVAFELDLPRAGAVEMSVHDLQGREVWRTPAQDYAAGRWTIAWPGVTARNRPARPGLYLARVRFDGRTFVRRVALVR